MISQCTMSSRIALTINMGVTTKKNVAIKQMNSLLISCKKYRREISGSYHLINESRSKLDNWRGKMGS